MDLSSGGDNTNFLFLAMAHWRLGQKDAAHHWYDRAAKWIEENAPGDEELLRFRAEAEQLLEIIQNDAGDRNQHSTDGNRENEDDMKCEN